jgi:hypothetical protein
MFDVYHDAAKSKLNFLSETVALVTRYVGSLTEHRWLS